MASRLKRTVISAADLWYKFNKAGYVLICMISSFRVFNINTYSRERMRSRESINSTGVSYGHVNHS